jgi:hypothetical protein
VKTSAYSKSGNSPPTRRTFHSTRRAYTTPGFHADLRKPDERELIDHRVASKAGEGRRRWASRGRSRRFVAFVPAVRYRPNCLHREEAVWDAEALRLLDEPIPAERFERPPGIDSGTWGLLLAVDVYGESLAEAASRMGINGKAAYERTKKRVQRARKVWLAHLAQAREIPAVSPNEAATA